MSLDDWNKKNHFLKKGKKKKVGGKGSLAAPKNFESISPVSLLRSAVLIPPTPNKLFR